MTAAIAKLESEIQQLPLGAMLLLHENLITAIQDRQDQMGLDPAWRAEIQRRIEGIESGKAQGVDAFQALQNM